jgi:GTP-binding protein EngB required for normal cell division
LNDNKSGAPTPIRKSHSPELQYKTNNFNPDMQKQSIISNSTIKNSNLMYKDNQSFITNTTIKKRDFKCTKDKRELMNELNYFLNQVNIQNQFFEKRKNLNDPVFELIQKEEKKIVNEFFYKNKDSFINELLNYLNYQKTNFNPNIIQQIINSENGYQIYKNKIENVISKINIEKSTFQIDHLTVLLLGKSGVGKTTLINKILGVNAPTGEGSFITTQTTPYQSKSMPFLRLVDTRGIELSVNFGAAELQSEAMRFIAEQIQTNNYNNFVHCIWYCITTKRFENVEIDILNRIRNYYQGNKVY